MSAITIKEWMRDDIRNLVDVRGTLLRKYEFPEDAALLDQDILEVALPNRIKIDVGWFPEGDPKGRFVIRVYRDDIGRPLRLPIETKDPFEVARIATDLVAQFLSHNQASFVSCSQNATIDYVPFASIRRIATHA